MAESPDLRARRIAQQGRGEQLAGWDPVDSRPMWQNPPTPPDPLVDALRDFASAVRDLATALRESTSERGQFRQLIPEDTDAELDPDLDGRS